jgi:hypothetical protein
MNKPRDRRRAALRILPAEDEVNQMFAGWRKELVTCANSPRPPATASPRS